MGNIGIRLSIFSYTDPLWLDFYIATLYLENWYCSTTILNMFDVRPTTHCNLFILKKKKNIFKNVLMLYFIKTGYVQCLLCYKTKQQQNSNSCFWLNYQIFMLKLLVISTHKCYSHCNNLELYVLSVHMIYNFVLYVKSCTVLAKACTF